jgi:hypothetical protein
MARDGLDVAKNLGFDLSSVRFTPPEEAARAIIKVVCLLWCEGDVNAIEVADSEFGRLTARLPR